MARIYPLRPRWNRKSDPVPYVVGKQMYIRARAESVSNPRTSKQQDNRRKLSVASRFLRQMQPMVVRGFSPRMTTNPGRAMRRVGAYQVALGELLNHAMRRGADGWEVDYASVCLSEGNLLNAKPVRVELKGRVLTLSFPKGLPKCTRGLRLAIHCPAAGMTLHARMSASWRGEPLTLTLPKWAKGRALHLYYTIDAKGKSRWASAYVYIPKHDTPSFVPPASSTHCGGKGCTVGEIGVRGGLRVLRGG